MSIVLESPPGVRAIDPDSVRRDFPIYREMTASGCLHYLDNAATTHKPQAIVDAIVHSYTKCYSPIHRGLYPMAEQATLNYEAARKALQRFLGASSADELVFTHSATDGINMVANNWLKPRLQSGDVVWVSRMEHHSNFLPWQRVCRECNAQLKIIELTETGELDLDGTPELFSSTTRFIALTHISNVLGIENDVARICALASESDIPVLVDAAQSASHLQLCVEKMGCDFLVFSAHKMFGPTGIGLLYGRMSRLAGMEPALVGGGMVDRVAESGSQCEWAEIPARFEAGSPDMPGAVAFAAAAAYVADLGHENIHTHIAGLTRIAAEKLLGIDGISLLPHNGLPSSGIVSFAHRDIHPHDLAQIAGDRGVAIRAGHHCAQPLLASLGVSSTVRASFTVYNDESDVDALVEAMQAAVEVFSS